MTSNELRVKLNAAYIEIENLVDEIKASTKAIDKVKDEIGELVQMLEDGELEG